MSVECGVGEGFPLLLCPDYGHLDSKFTFACHSPVFPQSGDLTLLCLGFPICMMGMVRTG